MSNFRITTVTAFVAIDPVDGDEGVVAFHDATTGGSHPCIFADEAREASVIPAAIIFAEMHNVDYRIIRLSERSDITEEMKAKYKQ